jgi:RHS repeat-associated protein
MASTLGTIQPFRYRGYVYDEETELYYLRSRYYNPVVQRFVSQDSSVGQKQLLRHSLYAYCRNEPVRHRDASGREDEDISFADLIVGTPWAEEYFYGKPTPKCENGRYYVITPHTHRAGVYIESSDGAGTVLGATAYRYNQSSGKPEYYVGRYENGYFYLNCEGVHGRSKAEFYEVIYDDDVGEAEYRYGHPTLVESSQTRVAYISIENLQRDLILLNYSIDGDVYGFYGAGTRKAVEAFQRENGLQDDGKAGAITKRTLLQCVKDHVVW